MIRKSLVFALCLLAAAPAWAAEEKEEGGGQAVSLSPVALPIVVDGRVVNYVFVTVRLELAPLANSTRLREREPFFRDALVRAAHRTPFTLPSDLTKVDEAKLKAILLREAQAIAGAGAVRSVTLVSQASKSSRVSAR
jgi:hypothetical protein